VGIYSIENAKRKKSMARTCAYCRQKVHVVEELRGSGDTGQRMEIKIERVNVQRIGRIWRTIQIKHT